MKKIGSYLAGFTALSAVFMVLAASALFSSVSGNESSPVSAEIDRTVIVIDAGHGGEDGGCVSADGVLEKEINLIISDKVKGILSASGYEVLMTRSDDIMLYDMYDDLEDYGGKKKLFDLKNRIKFTRENSADLFLSIHMNKFPQTKYNGLQVYYSDNNESSRTLAQTIKESNAKYLQKDNTREIKSAGSSIYVLSRLEIPAVLVECGFLSNPEEAALLCDDEYRNQLALVVAASVMGYNES